MTSQTEAEDLSFVERLPGWHRWADGAFLAIFAVAFASAAVIGSIWGFYLAAAACVLAAAWWCLLAKITLTVGERAVTLAGPAWKRVVQRKNVRDVSVTGDSGVKSGLVLWPVTAHERGSLTRLSLGGSAAVTFAESGGHRYRFVVANRQTAERMAEALTA